MKIQMLLLGVVAVALSACGSSSSSSSSSGVSTPACSDKFREDFDPLILALARAEKGAKSSPTLVDHENAARVCTQFIAAHGTGNCLARNRETNEDVVILGDKIQEKCNAAKSNAEAARKAQAAAGSDSAPSPGTTINTCSNAYVSAAQSLNKKLKDMAQSAQNGESDYQILEKMKAADRECKSFRAIYGTDQCQRTLSSGRVIEFSWKADFEEVCVRIEQLLGQQP